MRNIVHQRIVGLVVLKVQDDRHCGMQVALKQQRSFFTLIGHWNDCNVPHGSMSHVPCRGSTPRSI